MAPQSNILVLSSFSLVRYLKPWLKEIIVFQLKQKNIYIYIYIYKIAFHLKKKRKKKKIYIIAFHLKLSEVWNYSTLIQRKLSLSLSLSDEVLPDPNVVSLHFSLPQNRSSWPPFLGLKILSMQRFSHLFHSFNPKSWRAHGATDSAVASRRDSRDRWPHVRRKNHHPSSQNSIWEQQWQVCEHSLVLVTFFVCVIYMLEIYVGCK